MKNLLKVLLVIMMGLFVFGCFGDDDDKDKGDTTTTVTTATVQAFVDTVFMADDLWMDMEEGTVDEETGTVTVTFTNYVIGAYTLTGTMTWDMESGDQIFNFTNIIGATFTSLELIASEEEGPTSLKVNGSVFAIDSIDWGDENEIEKPYVYHPDMDESNTMEFKSFVDAWGSGSTITDSDDILTVASGTAWTVDAIAVGWQVIGSTNPDYNAIEDDLTPPIDITSFSKFKFEIRSDDVTTVDVEFQKNVATTDQWNNFAHVKEINEVTVSSTWTQVEIDTPDYDNLVAVGFVKVVAGSIQLRNIYFE
jgi:hypothetical protein